MEKTKRGISNTGEPKAFKYCEARLSRWMYRFSYNFGNLHPFNIGRQLKSVRTCLNVFDSFSFCYVFFRFLSMIFLVTLFFNI